MKHPVNCTCCPNPVIKETRLQAYPGWVVRQYQDGWYDGTDGRGLTIGCHSFQEVVAEIRGQLHG